MKSQIIFGVQRPVPDSIKRSDGSYDTSYSMLYKWKNPISFDG